MPVSVGAEFFGGFLGENFEVMFEILNIFARDADVLGYVSFIKHILHLSGIF